MKTLDNKNILLICPRYFGYDEVIENNLIKRKAKVYKIYENIGEINYLFRLKRFLFPSTQANLIRKYYQKEFANISVDIDYVFVIRGETLSCELMENIHLKFKNAKYIMYQWDSVKNNKNALRISKYFDSISTFDYEDSKKYNWIYRPLFYSEYDHETKKTIDISYICSVHSKRIKIKHELDNYCETNGFHLISYIYSNRFIFYKRKYIDKNCEFVDANPKEISFKPLSLRDTYCIYKKSKVVVDFTHPGQSGYTMRSIECLGNDCKLITNNKKIVNADFYNDKNIYIYEENEQLKIPLEFINTPYEKISSSILKKYYIDNWVDDLLNG